MDATGKTYVGLHNRTYTLDKKLGSGGEGDVYAVRNNHSQVAKVFKAVKPGREDKLKAMISLNIQSRINGIVRLTFPEDILYENGHMVGFVMPSVDDTLRLFKVCREKDKDKDAIFPNYGWKHAVIIAYNIAELVEYLHANHVIIGDFNPNNFVIDGAHGGMAVFVDCDSFDITDPKTGRSFPCEVAFAEVAAPELQSVHSFKGMHTVESDNFSLAMHIFRLLMNNMDPFSAVDIGVKKNSSSSAGTGNKAIIRGECPYVRVLQNKRIPDDSLPYEFLPDDIRALFDRVFNYNEVTALKKNVIKNRPTAGEWAIVLRKYAEDDRYITTCRNNPRHKYPSHNTECPWCKLERERAQRIKSVKQTGGNSGQHAAGTYAGGTNRPQAAQQQASQNPTPTGQGRTTTTPSPTQQTFQPGNKRREATLYYALYIIFGIASGFMTGPYCFDMYGLETYGLYFSDTTAIIIVSVIGFIYAAIVAYYTHERYENAVNSVWYLLLTANALIVPAIITSVLVFAIVLAIYAIMTIVVIACMCSMCGNS